MRAGALISDTAGDPSYSFTRWLAGAGGFGEVFSPYHPLGTLVDRRYLMAFTQTIYDVGNEQCLVRKDRLEKELLGALPAPFPAPVIKTILVEYAYPDAVSEKELEELAKIKALLDQEEVQRFMQEDAAMASGSAVSESA
jgi:hypothetical protein